MLKSQAFHQIKNVEITPKKLRYQEYNVVDYAVRSIILTNTRGEKFTIELFSDDPSNLEMMMVKLGEE